MNMALIYLVNATKEQAEAMKTFGLSPKEYNPKVEISKSDNFVKSDYIKLGIKNIENNFDENKGFDIAIGATETGKKWEKQNISLLEKSLRMSNPKQFMQLYNAVIYAHDKNKPLFDSAGNEVKRNIVNDLYKQMTKDEWTNLNMFFDKKENGLWTIKEAIGLDKDKNLIYDERRINVPLLESAYVSPKLLTSEGIPYKKLKSQKFERGKNIYFIKPSTGSVAGFLADVVWAFLYCDRDPSDRNGDLGVRATKLRE